LEEYSPWDGMSRSFSANDIQNSQFSPQEKEETNKVAMKNFEL